MMIKNKYGLTPTQYAEKRGYGEAVEKFRNTARNVDHDRKHRQREQLLKRTSSGLL